jgi:2-C-methyl-D-erythritol 4-phosphate cytidylyltransferase
VTVWGIVVAAGSGGRFGRAKHTVAVAGVPMWERARDALLRGGAAGVVVVGSVPGGVPGGARRRDSVAAGLAALPDEADLVLVHDAARPLATAGLVARVLDRLFDGDVDGVVPVVPVRDTIKRVAGDRVSATVDRDGLAAVQTPQAFVVASLREAHAADDADALDDAVLIERSGGTIAVVPGEEANLKVTYPGDLRIAEALLS